MLVQNPQAKADCTSLSKLNGWYCSSKAKAYCTPFTPVQVWCNTSEGLQSKLNRRVLLPRLTSSPLYHPQSSNTLSWTRSYQMCLQLIATPIQIPWLTKAFRSRVDNSMWVYLARFWKVMLHTPIGHDCLNDYVIPEKEGGQYLMSLLRESNPIMNCWQMGNMQIQYSFIVQRLTTIIKILEK